MTEEKKYPKVAVVILCWNGTDFLSQFLPPLLLTTYPNVELYVADNKSTDDSVAFVRTNFPQIKLIELKENLGFPGGYNKALKQVEADYYVLLNQDVEVTPSWIEPVMDLILNKPNCVAAQPKIRSFHKKTDFEYAGAAGGYMDGLGYAFCRGRLFDAIETDTGQYETEEEIFWATGAAMFIKADIYHQLGGLDTFFFAHMEEIDLGWRLKNAGYSIWYTPHSVVYHVGGGSLPQGNPRKTYLNFRNNLIILYKNLPRHLVWPLIITRFFLDFIALIRSLVIGNRADAAAISRAHRHFLKDLPWFRKERKRTDENIKSIAIGPRNLKGIYKGSIVFEYFVLGRTKTSRLLKQKFT